MSTTLTTIINFVLEHTKPDLQISDISELQGNQTLRQLQKHIIQEYQSTFLYRYGVALGRANIVQLNQATTTSPYKRFDNVFNIVKEQHITSDRGDFLGYYTKNILNVRDGNFIGDFGQYQGGAFYPGSFFQNGFFSEPNQQPANKETLSCYDCYIDENYVYTNSSEVWFYGIPCDEAVSLAAIDKMQTHEWKALGEIVLERKGVPVQSAQSLLSNICNQRLIERNVGSLLAQKLRIINFK